MLGNIFRENIEYVLDNIDQGIQIIDSSGEIIYYNKFTADLDNIHPESALGRHILEIYPSLTEKSSTILRVLRTGEPIMNYQQIFKNYLGIEITTINSTIPIRKGKKLIAVMEISRDITEMKKLSQRVVELQEKLLKDNKTLKNNKMGGNNNLSQDGIRIEKSLAKYNFADIIGTSESMLKLKKDALAVASSPSPIMIYGETGTGKELLVHAIHNASNRREETFIAQNCAALPETLLESILFGTVKGSFTGAENRPGLFELADGGTLFLDELNSMSNNLQAKLLRVIQDGNVRRVGDIKETHVDVRIITALNVDPLKALEEKIIREDLFYRLSVISLKIPALSEKTDDIETLVKYFISKYNEKLKKKIKKASNEVMKFFKGYRWPGNIRELEHAIEGAMNISDGEIIEKENLPYYLSETFMRDFSKISVPKTKSLNEEVEKIEREMIIKALKACGNNITKSADFLDIPRQTLQYKMGKYNLM